jgi:hypothetical protein
VVHSVVCLFLIQKGKRAVEGAVVSRLQDVFQCPDVVVDAAAFDKTCLGGCDDGWQAFLQAVGKDLADDFFIRIHQGDWAPVRKIRSISSLE